MSNIIEVIATAALTAVGGVDIPSDIASPVSYAYGECRALSALNQPNELDVGYHENYNKWLRNFFDIAGGRDELKDVSRVYDSRAAAKSKVARELVLDEITATNLGERLDACAITFRAMTEAMVDNWE